MEEEDAGDAPSFLDSNRKGQKVGGPRQAAFDNAQCQILVRAFIAAKNDPTRGAGQKREDYHATMFENWSNLTRKDFPMRSIGSLVAKYADIRHDCLMFQGILGQIKGQKRASGTTTSDDNMLDKVCFLSLNLQIAGFNFIIVILYSGSC